MSSGCHGQRVLVCAVAVTLAGWAFAAESPAPTQAGSPAAAPAKAADAAKPQTPANAAPSEATAFDNAAAQIKHPVDWFTWGADLRLRQEYQQNTMSLNDKAPGNISDYQRYRARVWGSLLPAEGISVNNRWTWEGFYYFEPDSKEGFVQNYVICDELDVKVKNLGGSQSTLTVGRQDIALLDGWLVLDGTPDDGSKTTFLDAVRFQFQFPNSNFSMDSAVVAQHWSPSQWIPTIMTDENYYLTEQNEWGGFLDGRYKDKTQQYDGYFIYKDASDPQVVSGKRGDDGQIYCFGGRAACNFSDHLTGRVEGAYETGHWANGYTPTSGQLSAWGVNARASYLSKDTWDNKLHLCFQFLSGDNPNTSGDEAFDLMWGRWPQFSELYVYTVAPETRIAQVTNLYQVGPLWESAPIQKMSLTAAYYALFADQNTYTGPAYGDGLYRGSLFEAYFRYRFNRYTACQLGAEYFIPGDYYSDSRQDNAIFLRAELTLTF